MSDAQCGHEKTLTGLMAALAGANLIYGLGMLESGITFDYAQLVLDNEFAGMIKQTVLGIPVSDETLAVDVIREIGPFRDFLSHDHTLAHMRAQSQPELLDRRTREEWRRDGGSQVFTRARQRTRQILETHRPEPLPQEVQREIGEIITETEREVGVNEK